jgi:acetyl esterase
MVAMDVNTRVEPGTIAQLDRLARWDLTSIETIRTSYGAVGPPPTPPNPKVRRTDSVIPGIDGGPDVPVRWYRPADSTGLLPCLVWLHGGAFIMGTLDENDARLERMVIELGCAVVSVDWRLAPEHPFPAGLEDAQTVWRRIVDGPAGFGVDGDRVVLGGASAGAGLAAGVCFALRDSRVRLPKLQLLVYPMLDDREVTPSIQAIEDPGHWGLWHLKANRMVWEAYLGDLSGGAVPPTAAPARADNLTGLPPAFFAIGDADAFLDENLSYASRLSNAGVPIELHVYPGVIHGGFGAPPGTPRTAQLLRDVYGALAAAFEPAVDLDGSGRG